MTNPFRCEDCAFEATIDLDVVSHEASNVVEYAATETNPETGEIVTVTRSRPHHVVDYGGA